MTNDPQTDRILARASEEVVRRNILTMQDYTKDSRKMVRELEAKVSQLQKQIRIQDEKFDELRTQFVAIQMKIYSGGTS